MLFHVGREAWLAGDYDKCLDYWQRAFHCGEFYQRQMIDWLAGNMQPEHLDAEIQFFLEVFQPGLPALAYLDERYRQIAPPEQTVALRRAYVEALEPKRQTLKARRPPELWLTAAAALPESDRAEPGNRLRRQGRGLPARRFLRPLDAGPLRCVEARAVSQSGGGVGLVSTSGVRATRSSASMYKQAIKMRIDVENGGGQAVNRDLTADSRRGNRL